MKLKIHKPDLKGGLKKIKNLKREDVKAWWKNRKERRARILEERKNSEFAKKMKPVYAFMNRFSLVFHALLACVINFAIEAISRHSVIAAGEYMIGTPLVFLYNAFMIFITFSVVYFFKRRIFVRIIISVIWLILGVANGYMLLKRVTPFNAQDLKAASEGLSLISNYFNGFELIILVVGIAAVIVWVISMWKRGGQYSGKVHRVRALIGVIICAALYAVVSNQAVDKRVVSTYFGNIAFAYEDYGLPYCFMASLFNTGINEPNDYSQETMEAISNNGEITKCETGRADEALPNILFVQLESYFDVSEAEFFTTSKDACPNLRSMFENYSSGYFKVPSVGAGTANTEFEVLTGMNLRYFGPGEYPYKTYVKENVCESVATALSSLGYGTHALHNNGGNFYSRARVFNNMGFDSFTSKEFMNILQKTENGWSKDDILLCALGGTGGGAAWGMGLQHPAQRRHGAGLAPGDGDVLPLGGAEDGPQHFVGHGAGEQHQQVGGAQVLHAPGEFGVALGLAGVLPAELAVPAGHALVAAHNDDAHSFRSFRTGARLYRRENSPCFS